LSRITDADKTVGTDEHVPRVYLKIEEGVIVCDPVIRVKQCVEGVWVNVIEQRWEISWINTDSIR